MANYAIMCRFVQPSKTGRDTQKTFFTRNKTTPALCDTVMQRHKGVGTIEQICDGPDLAQWELDALIMATLQEDAEAHRNPEAERNTLLALFDLWPRPP